MSKTKRIVNTTTERTINKSTGEVLSETTSNVVRLPQEPPYIKMYLDDLCELIKVPGPQRQLLEMMLQKLDYEGFITLSPRYRKKICERLKIKDQTFRNYLGGLCKSQILKRQATNEYEVNPRYFARGEWRQIAERREQFEMRVVYGPEGRQIVTDRVNRDDDQPDLFDQVQ